MVQILQVHLKISIKQNFWQETEKFVNVVQKCNATYINGKHWMIVDVLSIAATGYMLEFIYRKNNVSLGRAINYLFKYNCFCKKKC